jgi:AraC-like DNA-binding protein
MTTLEAALRGGAIALFLLLAIVGFRDGRASAGGRYGTVFALCAIGYVIEAWPGVADRCPPWVIPFRLLSLSTPAVFYLWAAAHFDDDFTPSWRRWLPWFGMLGLGGWAIAVDRPLPWRLVQLAALVLVALGAGQALAGRPADLVERRRSFRLVLAIGAGLFIAGLNLLSFIVPGNPNIVAGISGPIALVVLAFVATLLGVAASPAHNGAAISSAVPATQPAGPTAVPTAPPDPQAGELLVRLQRLMEHDRVYREEGFGIAALASHMNIPEYRLRRLINQELGHRNFVDFVNRYRLAETKAALIDPSQESVPILTIALDAGFQSIGPFNRAFKAHTGMTPSEYRRDHLRPMQPRAAE